MKKLLFIVVFGLVTTLSVVGCSNQEKEVTPENGNGGGSTKAHDAALMKMPPHIEFYS